MDVWSAGATAEIEARICSPAGWPVICNQLENYGSAPVGTLPKIQVSVLENPMVQVFEQNTGEKGCTLRISGHVFPDLTPTGEDDC